MRAMGISAVAVISAWMMVSVVFAMQHEATADKGKVLFNDAKLGSNGKTCNDCHKNGAGLEKAGVKNDLETTVNTCIKKALNGKALKNKSVEMQSMVLYIKGLGGEKKPAMCHFSRAFTHPVFMTIHPPAALNPLFSNRGYYTTLFYP